MGEAQAQLSKLRCFTVDLGNIFLARVEFVAKYCLTAHAEYKISIFVRSYLCLYKFLVNNISYCDV